MSDGEVCDDGMNTGAPGTCAPGCGAQSGCGDGQLDPARGETCDDGNHTAGDGCDALCQIELG
jgi:cysteine-rich repeat protein